MNKEATYKEKTAAEIIKKMEFFDGFEKFKKPLTKKQFLAQRIGLTLNFPLEEVADYFGLKPDELTLSDVRHYIPIKIDEVTCFRIHRPWEEGYDEDDEVLQEGDLIVMDYM